MFSFLNDILYKKSGNKLNKDNESEFNAYMIQRWSSMYSAQITRLLNNTTNRIWSGIENNDQWYKLFTVVIPRLKYKRIKYIKKAAKDSGKDDYQDVIIFLAKNNQLSVREVEEYVKTYNLDLKKIRKSIRS